MTAALIIIAALVILYASFGAAVFLESIKRPNRADLNFDPASDDEKSFAPSGRTPFRLKSAEGNIWWNTQPLERLALTSGDGLALVGHLLRAKTPSDKLALVAHGHLCVSGEMGFIARMYHERGYNVFMADQRAHGKSEGEHIGMGLPESRDMLEWLALVEQRLGGCRTVLHGISMGAATVMLMAGDPALPPSVICAVEDCGYTDAWSAIEYVASRRSRLLPFKSLPTSLAGALNRALFGFGFKDVSPLAAVGRARVPVLFIHGDADPTVPVEMARELFHECASRKELLIFEGAAHGVSYFCDPERYEGAVFEFIDGCLAASDGD